MFGHPEGVLEQFVEVAACRAELGRCRIGFLDLAENLRFPENHRIEAAGHTKQVPHPSGSNVKIQRRLDPHAISKQSLQRIKRAHGTEVAA